MKATRIRFNNGSDETEFDTVDRKELALLWYDFCKENGLIKVTTESVMKTTDQFQTYPFDEYTMYIRPDFTREALSMKWMLKCIECKWIELDEVDIEDEESAATAEINDAYDRWCRICEERGDDGGNMLVLKKVIERLV